MKCLILFSWKNKKNISKCHLLKYLPSMQSYKTDGYLSKEEHSELKVVGYLPFQRMNRETTLVEEFVFPAINISS